MDKHPFELCFPPRPHLSPYSLPEIQYPGPDRKPPALVPQAMIRTIEREICLKVWGRRVPYETACGMRVERDHEEERQVMRVPKRLKALGADFMMGSAVHDEHKEDHEMSSYSSRLGVVNLQCQLRSELALFDVYEVYVVGGRVNHCPEGHCVAGKAGEFKGR